MSAKTCAYCQQDCSTKPRMKDEAGHYFCKECFPLAKAEAKTRAAGDRVSAGAASPPAVMSVFDDPVILDAELVGGKPDDKAAVKAEAERAEAAAPKNCPSCGLTMAPKAKVCTNCGFNTATGKGLKTKIEKPLVIKDEKAKRRGANISIETAGCVLSVLAFVAGFAMAFIAGATDNDDLLPIAEMTIAGSILALHLTASISAFTNSGFVWGIVVLFFVIPGLYWTIMECEHTGLKWLYGIVLVLTIIGRFATMGQRISDTRSVGHSPAAWVAPHLA